MNKKTLLWFRKDLRVNDNPALYEASQNGEVMAIYILDDEQPKIGEASRWWLHHSLLRLAKSLDNKLNIYQGDAKETILYLLESHHFDYVYWNRCYEPWRIKVDFDIKSILKAKDIACKSFNASLLWEPMEVLKSDGNPYKVFTPFYRKGCLQAKPPRQPLPKPERLDLINESKTSRRLEVKDLNLLSSTRWYDSLHSHWIVGEEAAQLRLSNFLENSLQNYKSGRDFPAQNYVSRLSPHLHFGEISPHQVLAAVKLVSILDSVTNMDVDSFLNELGWREFSYHLLYHFPNLPRQNFQKKFDKFPWQNNSYFLEAWQKGQTGYPIVDAGMRELWQTGYMHNRLRMIVGSFLVKNLLIHWKHGEAWFWDCLVDADLANNSASWQWIAGSGADAAPYFRIFNPITQGEKFDSVGTYTRKFIPELARLPNKYLFKPWQAPEYILKESGIVLGYNYPKPIVDIEVSRKQALIAFSSLTQ